MEITLDIGKNTAVDIEKISKIDGIDFEITALKLLDLGIRVHLSSLEEDTNNGVDPILMELYNEALKSNYLLKEVVGHVFDKDSSTFKAYDASSACHVAENMARAYIDGKTTSRV